MGGKQPASTSLFPSWFPVLQAWPLLRIRCSLLIFLKNKMPDVDSYDSSSGITVDVQQRLNCALL
jgi:hypothetical protein